MTKSENQIILYTSSFCGHSWAVERFMKAHKVPVKLVNVDKDPEARQKVMALNDGFASVPTLLFPNGEKLTEPSFHELRAKLGIKTPGFLARVRAIIGRQTQGF
jgi:mycoredoxin